MVLCDQKDDILDRYVVLKCSEQTLNSIPVENIVGFRRHAFGVEALVRRQCVPPGATADPARLEDVFLYFIRGEEQA